MQYIMRLGLNAVHHVCELIGTAASASIACSYPSHPSVHGWLQGHLQVIPVEALPRPVLRKIRSTELKDSRNSKNLSSERALPMVTSSLIRHALTVG
jgi:hypothetical protein